MYTAFQRLSRYIQYLLRSTDRHGVHSPFLYEFVDQVLRRKHPNPSHLEDHRAALLNDPTELEVDDLGAGSTRLSGTKRRVKDIARTSLSSPAQCRVLGQIVEHYQIKTVLEFGSSLGLSASYMAAAGADVISMEGSEAIHQTAKQYFADPPHGPDFRQGDFDDILPGILLDHGPFDLVFLDGNHRLEATLRYFEQVKPNLQKEAIVIVDDIHWSAEMEQAWDAIRHDAQVSASLDLFWCGVLFFREGMSKEHFTIRY